jgi:urea transport system permease protein
MPDSLTTPTSQAETETPAGSLTASLATFQRSQTFLARLPDPRVFRLRLITVGAIAVMFFVVIPILGATGAVDAFQVNRLGKYLSLGLVALGIDLIWGYTGILSLCQAMFFCLGAYAMGMHLSLPEGGGKGGMYSMPQFLEFAFYGKPGEVPHLPTFWVPFRSMFFTIVAGIVLPMAAAGLFGFVVFRSRVRGVYFSIVTQAVAWGTWLVILRNEMLLGGTNGLTNFYPPLTTSKGWIISLYLLTLVMLVGGYILCRVIANSKLGRVLIAIRDKETRLYFAGYRPYAFKVFAFTVAAALAGVGGMLYTPQTGIINPQNMSVEASIFMVLWVAVGGRGKLWGAIFGALLVNYIQAALTSDLSSAWPYVVGGMYVIVVLAFPDGIAGLWNILEKQLKSGDNAGFAATGTSLFAPAIFILLESLGLWPRFLSKAVSFGSIGSIPPKYILLVILLSVGIGRWVIVRQKAKAISERQGFAMMPSTK